MRTLRGGRFPVYAQISPYAPLAILAIRSIALRFCRGAMVGACKLMGRALDGVAIPLISDNREIERREELTSPCTDAGRAGEPEEPEEVDRDRDGPMGSRN